MTETLGKESYSEAFKVDNLTQLSIAELLHRAEYTHDLLDSGMLNERQAQQARRVMAHIRFEVDEKIQESRT